METTTDIHDAVRAYLAVFFTFVAAFYSLRIFYMKSHVAAEVVFPGRWFSGTWWNHMVFRCFRLLIWAICVIRQFEPSTDRYLGMIGWLQHDWLVLSGAVLLTLGFALAIAGHFDQGRNWRSGIERAGPPYLKVTGLYRFSRNPIFLGVAIAQIGFFLALPSCFTLICLGVGLIALNRQILSEERHLEETFKGQYRDYTRMVRRWI